MRTIVERGLGLLGIAGLAGLVLWAGAAPIGAAMLRAWWALPPLLLLHGVQLWLSAVAWRGLAGGAPPSLARWWRVRWVREAVNTMLPVAQIGGNVAGVRLLAQAGTGLVRAAAATVLDLTAEAASQAVVSLAGVVVLASLTADRHWLGWVAGGLVALVAGTAGFVAAQRLGLLRLIGALAGRAGLPDLRGLEDETARLARRRRALADAVALHGLAWVLGALETWLVLAAIGSRAALPAAFVIESLGMAARSAGFVVPGAIGVQESGFVLVGGLLGVAPDAAVALSMMKRARELAVGVGGLLAWQGFRADATATEVARSDR